MAPSPGPWSFVYNIQVAVGLPGVVRPPTVRNESGALHVEKVAHERRRARVPAVAQEVVHSEHADCSRVVRTVRTRRTQVRYG